MNLVSAMRRGAWAAMAAGMIAAGGSGEAALISNSTVIPDSEVLINFSGTGLDWVYAGAVQPGVSGFGMEAPSYRASEGWRFATASEWALRPEWNDFIKPGNEGSGPSGYGYSHVAYRFAANYWSNIDHVDVVDAAGGYLSNGLDQGSLGDFSDVWYVRDTAAPNAVPEPASLAMLGLGGIAALGVARRRRTAA